MVAWYRQRKNASNANSPGILQLELHSILGSFQQLLGNASTQTSWVLSLVAHCWTPTLSGSEVFPLSTATSATTIDKLQSVFTTHGLPKVFVMDNGTQFTSGEFQAFMKNNGIKHICASPYHPSTSGQAERSVRSFKEHMKCMPEGSIEERLSRFLFWYRLTPHSMTGVSPAELLLGRRPQSMSTS